MMGPHDDLTDQSRTITQPANEELMVAIPVLCVEADRQWASAFPHQ